MGVCVHLLPLLLGLAPWVSGADLVIRIPGDLSQQDGYYRLDYRSVGRQRCRLSDNIIIRNMKTIEQAVC